MKADRVIRFLLFTRKKVHVLTDLEDTHGDVAMRLETNPVDIIRVIFVLASK
jgi:hypothetical protein